MKKNKRVVVAVPAGPELPTPEPHMDFILHLVSEWPLGPPRFPVKKVVCGTCGKEVWLEVTPSYLLATSMGVEVRFVCTDCALVK